MAKKRVKRGYFSKVSTGEIPVFTGPVDFLNRSGPAGPVPALERTYKGFLLLFNQSNTAHGKICAYDSIFVLF
jgi:hypothetical protein